ncbi:hypothetical protein ABK040_011836 [Willaertia magna]
MNRRRVQYTLVLLVCSILFGSAASLPEKQEMDFGKIVHHIIIKFFIYAGGAYTAHYFLLKEVSKKGSSNSRNNNNNEEEEEEEKEESLFWTFRLMFYAVVGLALCFHVCFHLGVALLLLLANNDDDNVNTTFEYIRGSVIIVASLVNLICGFTSVVVVVGWFEQSRNGNVHVHQQFQLQYINGGDKRQKHYGTL